MDERAGLVVVCALMVSCAAFGPFPQPVPLMFAIAAAGAVNAAFPLMRTFGSALLGGVAAAGIGLAPVAYVTCSTERFTDVFACTDDAPTWHMTGSVLVAGLAGAGLVLARVLGTAALERQLAALRHEVERR
ncbi:hypothetical protein [Saccharothrix syringae]|uniref:Uncharacterized protein n=1 Tax=Saccharothrix syringae TaxID=103733 RepID=A0A5Q0H955_SACSY|nr:hypothetical protein [Saccharothrix syringae]QFZ22484.1 hypothetical protein EKG83_38215 [Saccharothrix syringae]